MSKGKVFVGAVIGAVTGFVAGILTAPKAGEETRAEIKEVAGKKFEDVSKDADNARKAVAKKASEVKGAAEDIVEDTKAKVGEFAKEAKEVTGKAVREVSDKTTELKGRTEQAIDGAKKGFEKKPKNTKK